MLVRCHLWCIVLHAEHVDKHRVQSTCRGADVQSASHLIAVSTSPAVCGSSYRHYSYHLVIAVGPLHTKYRDTDGWYSDANDMVEYSAGHWILDVGVRRGMHPCTCASVGCLGRYRWCISSRNPHPVSKDLYCTPSCLWHHCTSTLRYCPTAMKS